MNRITVELTGTSPTLHNNCQTRGEDPGWKPKTDHEQAESRLYGRGSMLHLPWFVPVIAIGRAAWSKYEWTNRKWSTEIVHAEALINVLSVDLINFQGDWTPQSFSRQGSSPVALPRFDQWSASFRLAYNSDYHSESTLRDLLEHSGRHIGLPQFAPFAGPGPWGRFEVMKWEPVKSVALSEATA